MMIQVSYFKSCPVRLQIGEEREVALPTPVLSFYIFLCSGYL